MYSGVQETYTGSCLCLLHNKIIFSGPKVLFVSWIVLVKTFCTKVTVLTGKTILYCYSEPLSGCGLHYLHTAEHKILIIFICERAFWSFQFCPSSKYCIVQ